MRAITLLCLRYYMRKAQIALFFVANGYRPKGHVAKTVYVFCLFFVLLLLLLFVAVVMVVVAVLLLLLGD